MDTTDGELEASLRRTRLGLRVATGLSRRGLATVFIALLSILAVISKVKNKHTLFLCQTNQSRHLSVKSGAITKQQAYHVCSLLEVRLKLALARWGGVMVVVVFEDNLNSVSS